MQASTPPPLATLATCATASRAAVGSGVGAVWRPRRVLGCLRTLPPEGGVPGSREETALCLAARGGEAGARAGLASAGCSADAPASGQAVGSKLARTNLDLGRRRWTRGYAERMDGKAKGLRACFRNPRKRRVRARGLQ